MVAVASHSYRTEPHIPSATRPGDSLNFGISEGELTREELLRLLIEIDRLELSALLKHHQDAPLGH